MNKERNQKLIINPAVEGTSLTKGDGTVQDRIIRDRALRSDSSVLTIKSSRAAGANTRRNASFVGCSMLTYRSGSITHLWVSNPTHEIFHVIIWIPRDAFAVNQNYMYI